MIAFDVKFDKSNRKAMNRNWSNKKANPALKTKKTSNFWAIFGKNRQFWGKTPYI